MYIKLHKNVDKLKILIPLQKLPKNVGDLGKPIVAKGFEKWPKVQLIAQSGHTKGKVQRKIRKVRKKYFRPIRYDLLSLNCHCANTSLS